jgi:subtilisin family serine protease
MPLAKQNYIHLKSGRFAETTPDDLEVAFERYTADAPKQGWVLHFHGGLVNRTAGLSTAEKLLPVYQSAGAYPYFFIWEAGAWETIRNNLGEIVSEPFFRKLVAKLTASLIPRLIGHFSTHESVGSPTAEEQVERWFVDGSPGAPFDEIDSYRTKVAMTEVSEFATGDFNVKAESVADEEQLRQEIQGMIEGDVEFEAAYRLLQAKQPQPQLETEAVIVRGDGVPLGAELSPAAQQELFGVAQAPGDAEELISLGWAVRVARVAAKISWRVLKRYRSGRDHGLTTTVIEESLRELYVDAIGSTLFWNNMKRDTKDAYGGDAAVHGGTAFLKNLYSQISRNPSQPPRITLVGHSAGAIHVSHFLLSAHEMLPESVRFDVVLLAPAVDSQLFASVIQTDRIANLRVFGMSDHLESNDALLAPFHTALKYVYPRSLLYFVSGLLEEEVDQPLVGLQRYHSSADYVDADFDDLRAVRQILAPYPDRVVWSKSDTGPGRRSECQHHGDFDFEDGATLKSIAHIIANGFASVPGGVEISRQALEESLESFSSEEIASVSASVRQSCSLTEWPQAADELSGLLETLDQLPGGYLEGLLSADQVRPDAQLLRRHLAKEVPKADIAVREAFSAYRKRRPPFQTYGMESTQLESVRESDLETSSAPIHVPVLVRVRDGRDSLKDVKGLNYVAQMGSIIAAQVDQATLSRLESDPRVLSVEISAQGARLECVRSIPFVGAIDIVSQTRLQENGDGALVAIVDAGIDVLHAAFREPDERDGSGQVTRRGRTRLLAVWDQRDNTGPPPPGLEGMGGTLHTAAEINDYIKAQVVGKQLGRDKFDPNRPGTGHGTHVTSIAAGTDLTPHHDFPGGVAPEAHIVVVITRAGEHALGSADSIGYSLSHTAALNFVEQVSAGKFADDALFQNIYGVSRSQFQPLPVVVNLSQGMNSGGHDGCTLVERMFEDFCNSGGAAGRVVVKSAGNDRSNSGHAFITLGSNSLEYLEWESRSPTVNGYQRVRDVIELWFDSLIELSFRLVNPSGESSPYTTANQVHTGNFLNGNSYLISYDRFFKDNGRVSRLRLDIGMGNASAIEAGPRPQPHGRQAWRLEVSAGALAKSAEIDAWIDRTDALPARFIGTHVSEDRTLSVPGTSPSVIAVGAIQSQLPLRVGAFSAYGKTRDGREKPEICAPGVAIVAAEGGTEHGLRPSDGTSMAAPHATGAIALVLSACQKDANLSVPNASQIIGALRSAQWDRGIGYGPLNAKSLLEKFTVH